MQEKDARMFGDEVRERVYRGEDASYLLKGEMGRLAPADHGVRPLIGKFSSFNLSRLTPKQRRLFLEQLKYELSLSGEDLNRYLSERYAPDDMAEAWRIVTSASKTRRKKLGTKRVPANKELKRQISLKKQRKLTDEEKAARTAKARATRERNKNDPNYVSYATLKREFLRRQKLLADRHEATLKEATALFVEPIVSRKVKQKTSQLERENQQLKEYLRQNGLPLPGTKAAKTRRERLRAENED